MSAIYPANVAYRIYQWRIAIHKALLQYGPTRGREEEWAVAVKACAPSRFVPKVDRRKDVA